MEIVKTKIGRRSFLRGSVMAGGGMIIGFSWMAPGISKAALRAGPTDEWFTINGYLKIASNGVVTIVSPNPEGGQNVKTSMPMIIAEELDISWENVVVEQAPLNTSLYSRQFIGGSQALRRGWPGLRMAGASARLMLRQAAAAAWNVPVQEVTTQAGILLHTKSEKTATYGEMASAAAQLPVPENVELKSIGEFSIIGQSIRNVDGLKIVTGKPLFGIDYRKEGMLIAMIIHPPAFGMRITSVDDSAARSLPGIRDIFTLKVMNDDYTREYFDTCTFTEVAVVVGNSTWEVMKAKKEVKITCEQIAAYDEKRSRFGNEYSLHIPSALESDHFSRMKERCEKPGEVRRKDGEPEKVFSQASNVIERSYSAPFLAHNCMEPMNFFADVRDGRADLAGPLQKPEFTELALSARTGIPVENINIEITRLGGGYGRRSYAHWLIEAALISQKMGAPVKLIYSREDDMTSGIYRPAYYGKFRAALDENNKLLAYHVNIGGIPQSPLSADRFPAGAVDNYQAEDWTINSNITVGSFRAPHSNFMAAAEQSFLDEVAETAGKDPIDFRLELLERAINDPVNESSNDYEPVRYAGVLKLVREKSGWDNKTPGLFRGVSAYFCHNSYCAQVMEVTMENGKPEIQRVICAVDCGIVVNPDAARNLVEGAIVDGIGNALFGSISMTEGIPDKKNFDRYRMIRMNEAPKKIDVFFVESDIDPTGLGEPAFPPAFAALANALYKATGKRHYQQPFIS